MDTTTPAAGWYTDPQAPQQLRYWDGAAWTAHVSPAPTAAPPQQTAYAAATPSAPRSGRGLSAGAIVGIVIGVIVVVFVVLAAISIPVFVNQQQKATDAAAKSDAAELGMYVATYYVDAMPNQPLTVVQSGSTYVLTDGIAEMYGGDVSDGVSLGGSQILGSTDWCVWVSSSTGAAYEYSWLEGLSEGSC